MMENTPKRRRYQKDSAPADDIVTLINLVRQNPALYNYKLQPNQRRRIDILNGWAQIAVQIGNKYTVEECRRKWKNLRDTYHQYRLRKPKIGDGLSKWRYAKDMEFLSNVYQPKLKAHRVQHYNNVGQDSLMSSVVENHDAIENDHVVAQDMVHSSIISVNDSDTFILTAYEDVTHDNDVTSEDPNMAPNDLNQNNNSMDSCVEIIKHEQHSSLDDEGPNTTDVDYEEVCLYEEGVNTTSVDCEPIIDSTGGTHSSDTDVAKFQYIDTNDFCISTINTTPRSHYSGLTNNVIGTSGTLKLKAISIGNTNACTPVLTTTPTITATSTVSASVLSSTSSIETTPPCVSIAATTIRLQPLPELIPAPNIAAPNNATTNVINSSMLSLAKLDNSHTTNTYNTNSNTVLSVTTTSTPNTTICTNSTSCVHQRDECDLFFDFLKKKIQRFPPREITAIQVEFLHCVLRREAEHGHL